MFQERMGGAQHIVATIATQLRLTVEHKIFFQQGNPGPVPARGHIARVIGAPNVLFAAWAIVRNMWCA